LVAMLSCYWCKNKHLMVTLTSLVLPQLAADVPRQERGLVGSGILEEEVRCCIVCIPKTKHSSSQLLIDLKGRSLLRP